MDQQQIFNILRLKKTNNLCFDCKKQSPTWVNIKYAVIICTACASNHREMGFRLRSTVLDILKEEEIKRIFLGGNFIDNEENLKKKYKALIPLIEDLNFKVESDKRDLLSIINEEAPVLLKKTTKIEKTRPSFGKKIEKVVINMEKQEEEKVKEELKEVVIKEQKLLINKKNYNFINVDKNRLGFGGSKIKKEDEK